jgi:transposase-like protein
MLPTNLPQFLAQFGTEEACRSHLFALRWPDGFRCRGCQGQRYYAHAKRPVYECSQCGTQHSLLAGTIFEQTKTALPKWFLAIYLFMSSKGGISAVELGRQLGFGSDQTAFTWLHKLRRAMSLRGEPLDGSVEVDETFLGGPKPGKRGRGAEGKVLLAGAVETRLVPVKAPKSEGLRGAARSAAEACAERLAGAAREGVGIVRLRLGRVRLAVIGDAKAKSLEDFMKSAVAPATEVTTDGHGGYLGLDRAGFMHERIIIARTGGKAHEFLPAVHLVFALLKRSMLGTYHGTPLGRHLPAYLDEFVFRFNRRALSTASRALRLVDRAMATAPFTNQMILGHT